MRIHDWSVEDYEEYRRTLSRESQRRRREFAQANGLCIICCRNPARPNLKTCADCSQRAQTFITKRKAEYRKKGMCLQCGQRPPMIYHCVCKECYEKRTEYDRNRQ